MQPGRRCAMSALCPGWCADERAKHDIHNSAPRVADGVVVSLYLGMFRDETNPRIRLTNGPAGMWLPVADAPVLASLFARGKQHELAAAITSLAQMHINSLVMDPATHELTPRREFPLLSRLPEDQPAVTS